MDQVETEEPKRAEPPKSLFKSIVDDIKSVAQDLFVEGKRNKARINQIRLVEGSEAACVYTEVTREVGNKANLSVHWKLKNKSKELPWTSNMQLIPITSSPTLRIHFEA